MQGLNTIGSIPVVASPGRVTQYSGLSYDSATGVLSAPYIASIPYQRVGYTTVDFGAFPGSSDTSVAVTGLTGIATTSTVNAWVVAKATADHTADEHLVETIKVMAGNISAGVGFTIYAANTSQLYNASGNGTRLYGQWTVAYQWN